jgi:uncharacterized protein
MAPFIADDPRFGEMIRVATGESAPERIDTHGAAIFLAGGRAYKIKRPVSFPYMDLSTPAKRLAACEAEITLNRRTAPEIYLGLAPIHDHSTSLSLGAIGAPIDADGECMVVMREFDQDTLFDRLAARGRLGDNLVVGLAERIAEFHDRAEVMRDRGGSKEMRWVAEENLDELIDRTNVFDARDLTGLSAATREALDRLESKMDARMRAGFVRRCHGDLHLRNVCLVGGEPTIFDALEFNESLAITDTQYDLAYVLMDLLHRDRRAQACLLLNRYLERRPDHDGLSLLPFFVSVRAAVRAKVSLSMAAVQHDESDAQVLRSEARDYLDRAIQSLSPARPTIVAVGGFSGSGKSTVARALAPMLDPAPGAVALRSDVIRKEIMGVGDRVRLGSDGYTPHVSARVYATLADRAKVVVRSGFSAIGDATFTMAEGRTALARIAEAAGVQFAGFWLETDRDTMAARIAARADDPSDADAAILDRQLADGVENLDWIRLDARRPAEAIAADIATRLSKMA